ncbi:thioredoxin, mitochondrial-like [Anneissia japonica]|uniref:thioredoxin, mitochondrial-like n=1 Tax=Anneissia japonica TaxID=1529436 RepID=UPI0014256B10|nr:thioredoxin, mitochondrial-like [Anneissia japonica]XP_033112488.1 thioredoxin, mitochondrial-like [Anneissia japonica]XP_033112489.1 thioredoxin, mitochondrial-like [Anneissia japonica]XP_033112490.1 thioredoxin, mitochondrial-like [Anneissia japonica]XP_033112491.1 thioredoxin, mitochondrial-like [Anneissia japonica]
MALRFLVQGSRQFQKQLSWPSSIIIIQALKSLNGSLIHTTSQQQSSFNVQDEEDFKKRVLESEKPVLVDFHANWCGPCKLLGPRLEEVVNASNDRVDLAKVDIDQLTDLAMVYSVSSVPTVIAIKNGLKVDQFIGLQEAEVIEDMIAKVV